MDDPLGSSDQLSQVFNLNDEYLVQDEMDGSSNFDNSDESCNEGPSKNTPLREQDRFLPIANIAKIMKRAIPDNGKIAKDARECIQECVSEFISFITSEASDRCYQEKRKTINGEDILYAMCSLGFDHYIEPLTLYLHKYRETTKSDRNLNVEPLTSTTITSSSPSLSTSHSILIAPQMTNGNLLTTPTASATTTSDTTTLYYQNGTQRF